MITSNACINPYCTCVLSIELCKRSAIPQIQIGLNENCKSGDETVYVWYTKHIQFHSITHEIHYSFASGKTEMLGLANVMITLMATVYMLCSDYLW